MAGANVKLGVSGVSQFKSAMSQAAASVKAVDSALKLNEQSYKKTGDAETYMSQKAALLKQQMEAQRAVLQNAEAALKRMAENGGQNSAAFQKMQKAAFDAQYALNDMQSQLDGVGDLSAETAGNVDQLSGSLQGLNKHADFTSIISGVKGITNAVEAAMKTVVNLGKTAFNSVKETAGWADNENTLATIYGIDVETLQKMQYVEGLIDTPVEAIINAQKRLKKGLGNDSKAVQEALASMGLTMMDKDHYLVQQNGKYIRKSLQDTDELYWDIGRALMKMGDAYDKEAAAQAVFGRSWNELLPMFTAGQDAYNAAMESAPTVNQENIDKLQALDDQLVKLDGEFKAFKNTMLAEMAPAIEAGAKALSGLFENLNTYLQTDEGKKMLEDLGTAVSGLFSDLGNIDPEKIVEGFTGVFNTVINNLQWLVENKETVIAGMKAILAGWATLKLTGGALEIANMLTGIKGLKGTATLAQAGESMGKTWAAGFSNGLTTAAPWLLNVLGIGTLVGGTYALARGLDAGAVQREQERLEGETEGMAPWMKKLYMAAEKDKYIGHANEEVFQWDATTKKAFADEFNKVMNYLKEKNKPQVEVEPVPDMATLQETLNSTPVTIPAVIDAEWTGGSHGFANGISFVPYDGMFAMLHKGERVLTAGENRNYTANSHLYVENMNMGSGMDAEALAAAMAAQSRRTMAGFGN